MKKKITISKSLLIVLSVTACQSWVDPYVSVSSNTYNQDKSLENAIAYANGTKEAYYEAISNQAILNSSVGLTLIPISALAIFFGITSASDDVIPALGVSGAALYAGGNYLYSEPRQFIYAAGANAITCAVGLMEPLQLGGTGQSSFTDELDSFPGKIRRLEEALDGARASGTSPEIRSAEQVLAVARTTLVQAREARVKIETAGPRLYNAVEGIRGQVTQALVATEPNLTALVTNLASSLPITAGQITGVPLIEETTVAGDEDVEFDFDEAPVVEVELATAKLTAVIDRVSKAPLAEELTACGVDIEKAGLTFEVTPSEELVIDIGEQPVTASIVAVGGELPYATNWVGVAPSEDTVKLDLSYGAGAAGIVSLTVEPGASAARYTVVVSDSGSGIKTVNITLRKAAAAPATTATRNETAESDPQVVMLQDLLRERGYDPGKTDGILGGNKSNTRAAIDRFLESEGLSRNDLETEDSAFVAEVIGLLRDAEVDREEEGPVTEDGAPNEDGAEPGGAADDDSEARNE